MRWSVALRIAALAIFGLWLAGCASEFGQSGSLEAGERRQVIAAIRRYYESNAAEENNACSALLMSGVSRLEVVSDSDGRLVAGVTYFYSNTAHRGSMRCRGTGNREFTLARSAGNLQVVDMTGERRRGASWRIW
jgi:hypothetical protein